MMMNGGIKLMPGMTQGITRPIFVQLCAFGLLIGVLFYFTFMAKEFLSITNIAIVIEQSAILGVLAFGMCLVFIGGGIDVQTGGIDLSVAANAGLCGAIMAYLANAGYSTPEVIGITVGVGLAIGCLNAIAVAVLNIIPLLATLAVMSIAAGLELTITKNTVISVVSPVVNYFSNASLFGLSALAYFFIIVSLILIAGVHFTGVGVRLYAVGGHRQTAYSTGINVRFYIATTYILSGLCGAIAGILVVARLHASAPGTGQMLLPGLAAALLGLVFSRRFIPTIGGTLISALFIGFLINGFQLLGIPSYWVSGVEGFLILLVVSGASFARESKV